MAFWVYENTIHKKARLHKADCPFCNDGSGIHGGGKTGSGEWFGPFIDCDQAWQIARERNQPDLRSCETCMPAIGMATKLPDQSSVECEQNIVWQNELSCRLTLRWKQIGFLTCDQSGKLVFPKVPAAGGLYCFRTKDSAGKRSLYVGESDNLGRRFGNYRNPGPTQQTSIRINQLLRQIISVGGEIAVSIAVEAFVETTNDQHPADFSQKSTRRLFENFAISLENAQDVEHLNR
jgi:hypothetical protein